MRDGVVTNESLMNELNREPEITDKLLQAQHKYITYLIGCLVDSDVINARRSRRCKEHKDLIDNLIKQRNEI